MQKIFNIAKNTVVVGTLTYAITVAGLSYASGFQLFEQSIANVGNAQAGYAAGIFDASTEFYNPAALVDLTQQQVVLSAAAIPIDIQFQGEASTSINGIAPSFPVTYGAAQGGSLNVVPAMHYAAPIVANQWVIGVGVNVPFGLQTTWNNGSLVRYATTTTKVEVIDITPGVAVAVNPWLMLGVGIDIERLNAQFAEMCGMGPTDDFDVLSDNRGHAWGTGWHAGVLMKPFTNTRLGIAYHSSIRHHVHGTSKFMNIGGSAFALESSTDTLTADVTLPATVAASIYHTIDEQWAVMASVIHTYWSSIQELTLNNVIISGVPTQISIPQSFRNTWTYALAVNYKLNEKLLLRAGVKYDQTPTNDVDRNLRLPDENRTGLAVGAHWQATRIIGVDVAYEHLFIRRAPIQHTTIVGMPGMQQYALVEGHVNAHADVLGAQITIDIL